MAELKVTITDESGNQSTSSLPSSAKSSNPTPQKQASSQASPKTKSSSESEQNSTVVAAATMLGSKALNYCTSNIGKWSGNSNAQQNYNNVAQGASLAAMSMASPGMAAVTMAFSAGTTALDYHFEQKWNKAESNRKLAKAGYTDSGQIVGRRH